MKWVSKALQFGGKGALIRAASFARPPVGPRWFVARFLDASSRTVHRWGPRWAARHRLLGRELGSWILLFVWLVAPIWALVRMIQRMTG
jgi:hypothetical protein